MIDRNKIIENAYETIKDSLDFAGEYENYIDYVNGIIASTDALLEKLSNKKVEKQSQNARFIDEKEGEVEVCQILY